MTTKTYTGILIIGGNSKRMGSDKATMLKNNIMLANHMNNIINKHCDTVIVASNNPDHAQFGDILIPDNIGAGPLAGLYAGLQTSETLLNIVLPTDTPYITDQILSKLCDKMEDHDAIVAVDGNGKVHPLIGIYHKRITPIIKQQLLDEKYAVMRLLDSINTIYLNFSEVDAFTNINTKEDL